MNLTILFYFEKIPRWDINLTIKINTFAAERICFPFFHAFIHFSFYPGGPELFAVLPGNIENVYQLMAIEIAPEL